MVELSLSMPEGLLKSYVTLLESLQGLFKFMVVKTKYARAEVKAHDPVEIERRKKFNDDFDKDVLKTYDGYLAQGHDVKKAISLSNSALKAIKHPWATYGQVFEVLSKNGRFKGVKLYKKRVPGGHDGVVSSETPWRDPLEGKKV